MSTHLPLLAVAAAGLIAAPAAAVTLVSSLPGAPDPGIPSGFTTVVTFDTPSAAGIINSVTGNVITAAGSVGGQRAAPAGTPVGGVYQSIGTGGTSSFDFSGYLRDRPLTGLSLYWGSVDDYNFIDFYSRSGALLQTISGTDLPQFDGDQTAPITNRRLTFAIDAVDDVTRLVFRSTGEAFEFDTIAVSPDPVPEPGTWAMLIAGFGLVGAAMRRRQRQVRALA
jgi:hypothetical protein